MWIVAALVVLIIALAVAWAWLQPRGASNPALPFALATRWTPRGDILLVLPLVAADRTAGGLVIPDAHRERPQTGLVLAVGPGLHAPDTGALVPVLSQVGDLVTFGAYAGSSFEIDGTPCLLMRDMETMAAKAPGTYALVQHGSDGRQIHEAGLTCEACPLPAPSRYLAEERARLVAEKGEARETDGSFGIEPHNI
jgi:chaperonin GroES